MNNRQRIIQQTHREALAALILALGYFIWWYVTAYGFSAPFDDLELPALYFGMPLWFLLSCVVGPIVFTLLCALMVAFIYRDISLEPDMMTRDE
ncbi:YhdT family protein [Vibrio metschnikovii]|uniref:YhdT family protein n=2 Tax=Unclassified Bacteria TaxID=49928 RepID=A0AAU6T196_UNCXX|nr:YhdT family protein [Vibrio metschnikovii]EKO3556802.1 YhdT family protein [Vibrio metschnikovii]EKO3569035.1 YhdT family protein [Vibrio metschnikovii]EKO3576169.1 YhdT family protein [Vibrio metschnikovii]EKO3586498.1 YhdT family protein [Vibrio metschnikovii]EKO3595356.1 YhdT family protein [Vibrio metschnikovii]